MAGKELVLVSASKKCKPHAIIVVSLGFVDGKLLLADCQMKKTIKNLRENPVVNIVGGYMRLEGTVTIHDSGIYHALCVEKNPSYVVKHALLVAIKRVYDIDKVKRVV